MVKSLIILLFMGALVSTCTGAEVKQDDSSATNKVFVIKFRNDSVLTGPWAERMCRLTAQAIGNVYGLGTRSHCFLEDWDHPETLKLIEEVKRKFNADFQVDLTKSFDGKINFTIINLKQYDRNFTNKIGWAISYEGDQSFSSVVTEVLKNSYFQINHLTFIRDLLVDLVYKSVNPKFEKEANVSRQQLYDDLKSSSKWNPETRRFITAGSELLATLSFSWFAYNYLSTNQQDFDYQSEGLLKTLENKLTMGSMVRYDDNSWNTNKNHVFAGVTYYLECRGAGLTALQSLMCSIGGSLAWETLVEWREVLSINDTIFTSFGGAVVGESIHQLGNYIDQKAPPWFRDSIGWVWRGPKKLPQAFDRHVLNGADSDLRSDLTQLTGKFELQVGTVVMNNGYAEKRIGISNEVNTIPLYLESGKEVKFIRDIVETNFNFEGPNRDLLTQYDLFAKVVMSAYYNKDISYDLEQHKQGYSFFIGPSAAIDLHNNYVSKNDFMGIVHIVGTTAKLVNFYKGYKITSSLDIWGDSVMMKSMQVEKYLEANPSAELVGNLANADYYHGFGVTSRGQVIVEFGKWAMGASININKSSNTNSRQRDLNKALTELRIASSNSNAELFVERKISDNLKIKFAVERNIRDETIEQFGSSSQAYTSYKFFLTYYF